MDPKLKELSDCLSEPELHREISVSWRMETPTHQSVRSSALQLPWVWL